MKKLIVFLLLACGVPQPGEACHFDETAEGFECVCAKRICIEGDCGVWQVKLR